MSLRAKWRRKRRRKINPGWFKPGHDPRRHILTPTERWSGYASTYTRYGHCPDWLRWQIQRDRQTAENRRPPW